MSNKTQPTNLNANTVIQSLGNAKLEKDYLRLLDLFTEVTGKEAIVWGDKIIGFDKYFYKSPRPRGCSGWWPATGFGVNKTKISVYLMPGTREYSNLLSKLGKHKTAVSCLYINKLDDIDLDILKQVISRAYNDILAIGKRNLENH